MTDAETLRFIREEIKKEMNILMYGETQSNTTQTESIINQFPGMPAIEDRPLVLPYGVASRAPKGTLNVTGRFGEHIGNRAVLGHRDKNRPSVQEGETWLYNADGSQIKLKSGKVVTVVGDEIFIGSDSAGERLVLGEKLKALLVDILGTLSSMASNIATHSHPTAAPGPPSPPVNAASFVTASTDLAGYSSSQVESDEILSDKAKTEK